MNTHVILHRTILLAGVLSGTAAFALPTMDVSLLPNRQGTYDLRLTPNGDFDGLLSAFVITIGYEGEHASQGLLIEQTSDMRAVLPLAPSGDEHTVGPYRHRILASVAFETLASKGMHWRGGIGQTVATLSIAPGQRVWIVNDEWAKDRRRNGAYFISLNGHERTGKVLMEGPPATADDAFNLTVHPNPWSGGPLTVEYTGIEGEDMLVELIDGLGRVLYTRSFALPGNQGRIGFTPTAALATGKYVLRFHTADAITERPIMVASPLR